MTDVRKRTTPPIVLFTEQISDFPTLSVSWSRGSSLSRRVFWQIEVTLLSRHHGMWNERAAWMPLFNFIQKCSGRQSRYMNQYQHTKAEERSRAQGFRQGSCPALNGKGKCVTVESDLQPLELTL